ncbi:MAG: TonB-dependent receptor plug domain-containing protein, partial [Cyanobacteria bacterium P01_D01_bin.71]
MRHITGLMSLAIAASLPLLMVLPSLAQAVENTEVIQDSEETPAVQNPQAPLASQDSQAAPAAADRLPAAADSHRQGPENLPEEQPAPATPDGQDIPTAPGNPGLANPPTDQDALEPEESQAVPVTQITQIQLVPIEDGLQVVLVTADPTVPEVFQVQEQNTLVVDIVGAQLALPEGDRLQQDNPVPSVASIAIAEATDDTVQITIVAATETAPNAYLERAAEALILDIATTPPDESTSADDLRFGNNLRIIVAAEPLPRYQVSTASAGTRTDTDILDIPQGIQVIPEAVLEDQGSISLGEALRNASGVSAGRTASGSRATTAIIRGFETENILRNGLRDDTLRLGSGISNIERIEILKGPASVLFG